MGMVPVFVGLTPESGATSGSWLGGLFSGEISLGILPSGTRVASRDRMLFTQELATLLNAGVPLDRALTICAELTENKVLRSVVSDVLKQVRGGKSLAESMETHGRIFSKLYVNMVRAGQASGTLNVVFQRLAEFEETSAEWKSHLISAMIYPALILLASGASLAVLMNFVVPRFAEVFESTGLPMPLPTAILLKTSQWIGSYGWIAVLAVIAAVVMFRRALRTTTGREQWDRFLLGLPWIGELVRKAETARFSRTMATLIANGVPLVQSLGIVKEMVGNRVIANSLDQVAQGVKRGEGLAAPVRRTGVFPPLAAHLLTVGEETGRLDSMFDRLASIYDNETKVTVRRLTALFEPLVILGMGIAVGTIVLSLLMAITSINDVPF